MGFIATGCLPYLMRQQAPPAQKAAVGMIAFVTFQVPIYFAILALAGATIMQIVTAVASAIIVLTVSGRPYGLFLEWCRKLFRVYKNA